MEAAAGAGAPIAAALPPSPALLANPPATSFTQPNAAGVHTDAAVAAAAAAAKDCRLISGVVAWCAQLVLLTVVLTALSIKR